MKHREVYTVELYASPASGHHRGNERTGSGPSVRAGAGDGAQDGALRRAAGLPAAQAGGGPKLDAWVGIIDQILEQDKRQPRRQRHTAKRIHDRLKAEYVYAGGYTIVKDYVRLRKLRQRVMFVPLEHPPGDAQADFGEAQVVIAGVERKAHYLVVDLPQSDDCFVIAFPAEATEAFSGRPHSRVRVFRRSATDTPSWRWGGFWAMERDGTQAFSELQSQYLFQEKFGRPGKGNDKGKVEGLVGMRGATSLCRSRAWRVGTS